MIIATWNCNMAFRRKFDKILDFNPDILVVPECECPDRITNELFRPQDQLWFGDNETKGLGIFSFSDYRFELHENYNPEFKYIIPIVVTGGNEIFKFFAVWAMDDKANPQNGYIGQVWRALNYYAADVFSDFIMIGDLNSNAIWDRHEGTYSKVVRFLRSRGIQSVYHTFFHEEHGSETRPTFYMHRNENKPYHIDYCYLSERFTKRVSEVTVGNYNDWNKSSDHVPLIVKLT